MFFSENKKVVNSENPLRVFVQKEWRVSENRSFNLKEFEIVVALFFFLFPNTEGSEVSYVFSSFMHLDIIFTYLPRVDMLSFEKQTMKFNDFIRNIN
jgi:hypothetical protein